MLYNDRRLKIMELFENKATLKVTEISLALEVSVDTVRRDLKQMEKEGLVKYVFGGATLSDDILKKRQYGSFNRREIKNKNLKRTLVQKAIAEIREEDIIFINSGTTGTILAEAIAQKCKNISVITNNIEVANTFILIGNPTINVTCLGGAIDLKEKSTYGYKCECELDSYFPDVSFLSINAVNNEQCYTDFREHEVGIMKIAQKNSKRVVAIMDSTKFDSCSQFVVFQAEEIDVVYTDDDIDESYIKEYEEKGISIL